MTKQEIKEEILKCINDERASRDKINIIRQEMEQQERNRSDLFNQYYFFEHQDRVKEQLEKGVSEREITTTFFDKVSQNWSIGELCEVAHNIGLDVVVGYNHN